MAMDSSDASRRSAFTLAIAAAFASPFVIGLREDDFRHHNYSYTELTAMERVQITQQLREEATDISGCYIHFDDSEYRDSFPPGWHRCKQGQYFDPVSEELRKSGYRRDYDPKWSQLMHVAFN